MKSFFLSILCVLLISSCSMTSRDTSQSAVSGESRTVATPVIGSGKHMIQIFADFQCPACIHFSKTIAPIIEEYAASGKIQIEYRQYPLQMHKNAYRDAIAALCAAEQGKYVDFKKALYTLEEGKAGATVEDEDRVNTAKEAGLDGGAMQMCLATNRYEAQVKSDMTYGDSLRIQGTPTLILDGKKLDLGVFRDLDMFKKFLDKVVSE